MVCFKITDGEVTRKFTINPGEVSFEQLQKLIAEHFPKSPDAGKDLHLKYRDADGDIITISTDREFQEALSELPKDHVWKLHIHGAKPKSQGGAVGGAGAGAVPSHFFFQPSHSLFSHPHHHHGMHMHSPWHGFGHHHHHFPSPWSSGASSWGSPWGGWSSLDREFDKMLREHSQLLNTLHNDMEDEPSSSSDDKGEAKAEGAGATGGPSKEVAEVPGMKIKNFGSWDPKSFEGPYGKGRIIGPVGYYVSWTSGPEGKEEEEKVGDEKQEEKQEEKPAEEGMDTK